MAGILCDCVSGIIKPFCAIKESTSAPAHLNIAWSSSPAIKESVFYSKYFCHVPLHDRSCASSINTTSNFGDLSDLIKCSIMSLKSIRLYSFLYRSISFANS